MSHPDRTVPEPIVIIGTGRMGHGLARALREANLRVTLLDRTRRADDTRQATLVLIATPDDAIAQVAAELARDAAIAAGQVVLHLSGLLDRQALDALAPTGAALGSLHPLQAIADPATAAERLRGSFAGIEGDPRALEAGEALAAALGMRAVRLAPGTKPAYHAGAVLASNYVVVLADVAQRLARQAGVGTDAVAELYLPLMRGTVANLAQGPAAALTGPVRRGDAATVRAHLAALGPEERVIYCTLGLVALQIAREAGLEAGLAAAVERALRQDG